MFEKTKQSPCIRILSLSLLLPRRQTQNLLPKTITGVIPVGYLIGARFSFKK